MGVLCFKCDRQLRCELIPAVTKKFKTGLKDEPRAVEKVAAPKLMRLAEKAIDPL
jgi:hypothetical protein